MAAAQPDGATPEPHSVFVSYSHHDRSVVQEIIRELKVLLVKAWYDVNILSPGDVVSLELEQQLEKASTLVAMVSQQSVASKWVQAEIGTYWDLFAHDETRRIIPVQLDDARVPQLLRAFHGIDGRNKSPEDLATEIANAIHAPLQRRTVAPGDEAQPAPARAPTPHPQPTTRNEHAVRSPSRRAILWGGALVGIAAIIGITREFGRSIVRFMYQLTGQIKPGGSWIQPQDGAIVGDQMVFAVHAYPTNEGDPAIEHVNFTVNPPGGGWTIAAQAYTPTTADIYEAPANLRTLRMPPGPLTISFDVYDTAGNHNLSPNGVHHIKYQP